MHAPRRARARPHGGAWQNPYGDEGMGYDQFVCVESAQASAPVVLAPMEYWVGAMDVVP